MAVGAVIGNPSKHCRKALLALLLIMLPLLMESCNEIHIASFVLRYTPVPLLYPFFIYSAGSHKPGFIYNSGAADSLVQQESRFPDRFFRESQENLIADVFVESRYNTTFCVKCEEGRKRILSFSQPLWFWLYYEPWEPMLLFATLLGLWLRAPARLRTQRI